MKQVNQGIASPVSSTSFDISEQKETRFAFCQRNNDSVMSFAYDRIKFSIDDSLGLLDEGQSSIDYSLDLAAYNNSQSYQCVGVVSFGGVGDNTDRLLPVGSPEGTAKLLSIFLGLLGIAHKCSFDLAIF